MKISLSWLKDYIDIKETPEELSEILTAIGLEVEGLEVKESIKGGLEGLVIGEVKTCNKHPNADKLSLTTVDVGGDADLQIVCGAPNVAAGQKVVVATVGTMLYPTSGEAFKIKKGKIRGEVSEGMICAEDEIGIGSDHSGIIVLPKDVKVGSEAKDYYNVETDVVYDIGLTPNRSDATSHLGVAEDLAAYYSYRDGTPYELRYPNDENFRQGDQKAISVKIENVDACPRYSGMSIGRVKVKSAPEWMQNRLKSIDVRPINNVVDITNYILHEYGQPLHAFDATKIGGNGIVVKTLAKGTRFETLDEVERELQENDLMICDGDEKPMCIAGVFGGIGSGVTTDTTEIFLESAHFEAQGIRKTSTKHNLRTDAAKVYEKGSDPNVTIKALKRAVSLLVEYADATPISEITDVYPEPIKPHEVVVRSRKVAQIIGNELSDSDVEKSLRALKMDFEILGKGEYKVSVPTNKSDVTREVDVIEEILRIYGYDNVAIHNRLSTAITPSIRPDMPLIRNLLANHLIGKGYNEIMGLSLIQSNKYSGVMEPYTENAVVINNTSNIHLDIMRPEMMTSVMESVVYNHNRQQRDIRFFEFGKSYSQNGDEYIETEQIAIAISGNEESESWINSTREADYYSLKRVVLEIMTVLGIEKYQSEELNDERFGFGMRYFRGRQQIVKYGQVSQAVAKNVGAKIPVYYAEFDMDTLLSTQKSNNPVVTDIPKYPSSRRDVALVVDERVSYSEIDAIINKVGKQMIESVNLFDVYQDSKVIGDGKKSYAISIQFVDPEKNLKDKELDKIVRKIVDIAAEKVGASLR